MTEQEQTQSHWQLVNVDDLSVAPGIQEARQEWQGKQVWCLTPWKEWRRGLVKEILNDGAVLILIYQHGTPGIRIACHFHAIPHILKHFNGKSQRLNK